MKKINSKRLSELIADYEKTADKITNELSEVKGTMIANFDGRHKHLPKLLDGSEKTATQMFIAIAEGLIDNRDEA